MATTAGGAGTVGMTTRRAIIVALRGALSGIDVFRAAWLGGSDATGRADGLSDIDLVCFIRGGGADAGFARVRAVLAALAPIERAWRLPSPTWHGGEQMFIQLDGSPDFGLVDVVLATHEPGFEFFVRERHGTPIVLFDHDGLIAPTPLDRAAHEHRMRERVETARGKFLLLSHLAVKESRRGRPIDAWHYYDSLVVRPLVDVLRAVHCPDRFDFGLRYLGDDLPPGVVESVELLVCPESFEAIPAMVERARGMMDEALAAWDARVTSSGGSARS